MNEHSADHDGQMPPGFPSRDEVKRLAGYWFASRLTWTLRNAEVVRIDSDRDAQRSLTVDFELPGPASAPEASVPWSGGRRLYVVPAALVSKEPRPSHVKVFDEHGAEMQLFTKDVNADISAAALQSLALPRLVAAGGVDRKQVDLVEHLLRELTVESGVAAELYAAMAEKELIKALAPDTESHVQDASLKALLALVEDLMGSTLLWVPLIGIPMAQRSLRFQYKATFKPSPVLGKLWQRVPVTTSVELEGVGGYPLTTKKVDVNTRGTSRRIWNRIARTIGFSSYELGLARPYMQRTLSYHLQVEAPAGVEVRRMRLLGRVRRADGEPVPIKRETTTTQGHLYFSKADPLTSVPAVIELRVVRRGLLFFPALVAALIATMLWFFAAHPHIALEHEIRAVTGSTLLIAPALLLVFAFRQEEHPLLTHLLSGVRLLVLVAGVCSVAAAMAVVGIWPFGSIHATARVPGAFWESAGRNWHYEAIIATAITAMLVMAWLLAMHAFDVVRSVMRKYCSSDRLYALTAIGLIGAQLGIVVMMRERGNGGGVELIVLATVLGLCAAISGWLAAYGEVNNCRISSTFLVATGFTSLLLFLSYLELDFGLRSWTEVSGAVLLLILFTALGLLDVGRAIPQNRENKREAATGFDLFTRSAQGEERLTDELSALASKMLADYSAGEDSHPGIVSSDGRLRRCVRWLMEDKPNVTVRLRLSTGGGGAAMEPASGAESS